MFPISGKGRSYDDTVELVLVGLSVALSEDDFVEIRLLELK